MGLVAVLLVFLPKWFNGELLREDESFGLLALIYYLFFGVNNFTWFGLQYLQ